MIPATVLFAVWVLLLPLEVADVVAAVIELRAAGRPGRTRRVREQLFSAVVGAIVFVLSCVAIDLAVRAAPRDGFWIAAAVLLVIVAVALVIVVRLGRPGRDDYRALRRDARALRGARVERSAVEPLRVALESADARQARRARDAGLLPRLIPVAVAVALLVAAIVVVAGGADPLWLLAVIPLIVSVLLAVVAERTARAARAAWSEVYARQRAEAVAELDQLERRVSRGNPGLADRVSRALAILREQQGGGRP